MGLIDWKIIKNKDINEYKTERIIATISLTIGKKSKPWLEVGVIKIIKREEKRKYLVIFIHFKNRLLCTNKVMIEKIAIGIAIKNIDSLNFFKK